MTCVGTNSTPPTCERVARHWISWGETAPERITPSHLCTLLVHFPSISRTLRPMIDPGREAEGDRAIVYTLSSSKEIGMKFSSKILVGLLTSMCIASGAYAQTVTDTLKKIKESGTVVIGHRDTSIPFSYLDDKQQPIGYSMDICMKVVEALKAELQMPNLQVKMNPVTSATRIPLMQNGTIDL